ncbi:MAG: ATPase, partial [Lachnospiraceae bacterium]|nr:ATPase [Lachnospiraceae bacterium]
VMDISCFTTLSGYIHWQMTGQKVIGIGDASGMFPIDSTTKDYNKEMIDQFNALIAPKGYPWRLQDILPKALLAGEDAGTLTEEGAKKLDVSGKLKAGIPIAPPEGDAGTGMSATNSVAVRTGNVSAGTSVFAMIVLEKELAKAYPEIDMVTTPVGDAVAMVHCNNCTSDLNAWVGLFREFAAAVGADIDTNQLFGVLYNKALEGDKDCGSTIAYNYFAGEPVTGLNEGRPLMVRTPDAKFNLANFMRANLYGSLATLKIGLDLLLKNEDVQVDRIMGHGGLFKTKGVGQSILAAAINSPVSVMETAGEGGPWGMAILASYLVHKKDGQSLDDFLNESVFAGSEGVEISPDPADVAGFDAYIETYKAGIAVEKAATEAI